MIYKKTKNEDGNYMDSNEVRYDILEVHEAYTPQGLNVGWDEYPSLEAAAEAYGLTKIAPEEETPEEEPKEGETDD